MHIVVYTDMKGILTRKSCSFVYAKMLVRHRSITPEKNVLVFSGKDMHGNSETQKVSSA